MFEALGNDAQGEGLNARDRIVARCPVAQHAGQGRDFGEPPPVVLAFKLDREGHGRNVPPRPGIHQAVGRTAVEQFGCSRIRPLSRRNAGYVGLIVLILGLGIGVTTAALNVAPSVQRRSSKIV